MPGSVDRPLLFLDVDGPLIPFGGSTPQPARSEPPHDDAHPLLARLDPEHGRLLSALPCDLVWATTWMADANEVIAPRLGLPDLPVVHWPDEDEPDERLHWKTRGLVEWAAGRAFVWVDDELTDRDRVWVAENHGGRALLHRVDPGRGLTGADFAAIGRWLAASAAPRGESAADPPR
ncbi:HAD domain-containing protein [Catellatospora sichuanensis]|uniref:HAD domain-containing protein n=1 Tax=Catellatospora sichuanensis TaxID=1969805 RepID=UPI001184407A|nr:HAD domain-containing protein [Catellatospora sichuanensis]